MARPFRTEGFRTRCPMRFVFVAGVRAQLFVFGALVARQRLKSMSGGRARPALALEGDLRVTPIASNASSIAQETIVVAHSVPAASENAGVAVRPLRRKPAGQHGRAEIPHYSSARGRLRDVG